MAVTLAQDDINSLTAYGSAVQELKKDIAAAKRAGLDTSALEQNLARIDSVRKGLIKEFAPQKSSGG